MCTTLFSYLINLPYECRSKYSKKTDLIILYKLLNLKHNKKDWEIIANIIQNEELTIYYTVYTIPYLEIMSIICWEPELKIESEVKKKFKTVALRAKHVAPSLCKTYWYIYIFKVLLYYLIPISQTSWLVISLEVCSIFSIAKLTNVCIESLFIYPENRLTS